MSVCVVSFACTPSTTFKAHIVAWEMPLWCRHRTCTNFLGLCQAKKYDGTSFHRSIPSFMIQGGRAISGEGTDDASLWGGAFADEFDDRLKHDKIGVLSSANAGPNTNKRQFFVSVAVL